MGRYRRGISLLEMLVAGALFLLVLTLVFNFLIPSFRNSSRSALRVEMQQQGILALDKLLVDMERSAPAGVTLLPSLLPGQAQGVAIQTLKGFTGSGLQQWEQEMVVYYWLPGSKRLKRESWKPGAPPALPVVLLDSRPSRITRQDFVDIINDGSASETLLATGVQMFRVASALPPALQPYEISISLERTVPGRSQPERLDLKRSVTLRNDW